MKLSEPYRAPGGSEPTTALNDAYSDMPHAHACAELFTGLAGCVVKNSGLDVSICLGFLRLQARLSHQKGPIPEELVNKSAPFVAICCPHWSWGKIEVVNKSGGAHQRRMISYQPGCERAIAGAQAAYLAPSDEIIHMYRFLSSGRSSARSCSREKRPQLQARMSRTTLP